MTSFTECRTILCDRRGHNQLCSDGKIITSDPRLTTVTVEHLVPITNTVLTRTTSDASTSAKVSSNSHPTNSYKKYICICEVNHQSYIVNKGFMEKRISCSSLATSTNPQASNVCSMNIRQWRIS